MPMSTMKRLFQLMAEKKASDIFLSVGSPINIKINGLAMPINQQAMDANTVRGLLYEVIDDKQKKESEDTLELTTAFTLQGVGSFRISGFRQKGSPAVQGECCVQFERVLVLLLLFVVDHLVEQAAHGVGIHGLLVDGHGQAVDLDIDGGADRQENVGSLLLGHQLEQSLHRGHGHIPLETPLLAAQQLVDAGLCAGLGVDLLHNHRTV